MSLRSSFINGAFANSNSNKLNVHNKFTKEIIEEVSLCSDAELELAISSSKKAFEEFKTFSAQQRYELLDKLINKVILIKEELANLICIEAGKPISYAIVEVERSIATLEFSKEESRKFSGETIPMDFSNGEGRDALTKKFPLGPIIAISPFNFPLNLALHKIGPALACGCSVVLKPSLFTPLVALKFSEILNECGYPKGTLNVVVCDDQKSETLVRSDEFKLLSFTGSPAVGWMLKEKAAKKKVTLELGGNAAVIIDKDVDLKSCASSVALGAFLYSGQICISTQRIIVHDEVYSEFKELLVEETLKLKVGDPLEKKTIIGPLIDVSHVLRIDSWVKQAIETGATLLCGGETLEDRNIYTATLLENVKRDQKVWTDEVFGPVAILEKFSNFDEAVDLVNESSFGLQVGVFSDSVINMKKSLDHIDVAGVIMNSVPGFRIDHMPYGGIKNSGLGREGIKYAIEDMTYEKLLVY